MNDEELLISRTLTRVIAEREEHRAVIAERDAAQAKVARAQAVVDRARGNRRVSIAIEHFEYALRDQQ